MRAGPSHRTNGGPGPEKSRPTVSGGLSYCLRPTDALFITGEQPAREMVEACAAFGWPFTIDRPMHALFGREAIDRSERTKALSNCIGAHMARNLFVLQRLRIDDVATGKHPALFTTAAEGGGLAVHRKASSRQSISCHPKNKSIIPSFRSTFCTRSKFMTVDRLSASGTSDRPESEHQDSTKKGTPYRCA